MALENSFDDFKHRTAHIEKVFVELIEFVDGSSDSELVVKISDVSEFINRSFEKLEKMAKENVELRKEIYISSKLKPFVVDT